MKTKMSKVFSVVCLLVCAAVGVQAQSAWKYPKVENGNTIVSRDAAGGIKSAALLTAAEKTWLKNTNSSTEKYNEKSNYNKVSPKFQVASTDASTSATWANAFTLCKSYSNGAAAGSWRLPTQRELMLIWMLKGQLSACPDIASNFWSSTNNSESVDLAWYVNSIGFTSKKSTSSNYYVRCVRDIE